MELKYLNTFRTITEEGSFAKAAERLNYTQSAITFQIGQLEKELSADLFEKIGRKMVLTKAGERLIPYVDEVLSSVEKLRSFEEELSECKGDLRVGVGETLLCYKIPSVLKKFHEKAPKVRLFLRSMNCYDIRDALLSGSLDLGVFYADVGGFKDNLVSYPLGRYSLALVASEKTKEAYGDFITENQRIPVPFIINEPNCIFRQIFERYLRDRAIDLDHTIELWSIPTIKNLVENDVGVSYLPRFSVEEELSDGSLAEIPTGIGGAAINAVCAHHKNKWLSPAARLFIELARKLTANF